MILNVKWFFFSAIIMVLDCLATVKYVTKAEAGQKKYNIRCNCHRISMSWANFFN